jgi:hypothetical protein
MTNLLWHDLEWTIRTYYQSFRQNLYNDNQTKEFILINVVILHFRGFYKSQKKTSFNIVNDDVSER